MSGDISHQILSQINRQIQIKNRSVILFMDNAGCHPHDLTDKYSNIKIIWLPPNTTSKLQPLDLGTIKNFKTHYRKFLLRYVLSKIDECEKASAIANCVNVLLAIRWVAQAWDQVKEDTICKCFRRAEILSEIGVVTCRYEGDPFADLEEDDACNMEDEIQTLCDQVMGGEQQCPVAEFIGGDDDLSFYFEPNDQNWDAELFSSMFPSSDDRDHESEDEDIYDQQPEPKLKCLREAIDCLENVQYFLRYHSHPCDLSSAIISLAAIQTKSLTQTSMTDYFQ